ncbi:unnamed protein product [Rhizophagus irregularis]|nr:unnamed protein product [Rhizophagus irregularis]
MSESSTDTSGGLHFDMLCWIRLTISGFFLSINSFRRRRIRIKPPAFDLNTNKILNRVSDLHDDVSQTILKINYDLKESELVFMKKSRKNHHQKKEENIRKKKKHREGEREEG